VYLIRINPQPAPVKRRSGTEFSLSQSSLVLLLTMLLPVWRCVGAGRMWLLRLARGLWLYTAAGTS